MGAIIPISVADSPLSQQLIQAGLTRLHQGKVRDTFLLPNPLLGKRSMELFVRDSFLPPDCQLLLQLATDRVSIFDFVLPALVQDKGQILTALTVFWLKGPLAEFNHHLVAAGKEIDQYLPIALRNNSALQASALVVKKLKIVPVECIVRGYLTGSGWTSYQKNGMVCGIQLPKGLRNGDQLLVPIFTPTTKAESGHDEHLDAQAVVERYGTFLRALSLDIYNAAAEYARSRGIIIADFKLEFGDNGVLADEVVTPDSSRFWHKDDWEAALAKGETPKSQDKEYVRDWGRGMKTPFVHVRSKGFTGMEIIGPTVTGIQNLNPKYSEHLKFIGSLEVPKEVLIETAGRYRDIFQQLTGSDLHDFQLQNLGIIG
ncbi:MAG: phosphoribosylaminoimidazolesuccinocarboxamide synthase [Candidatus Kerfeldbacteria bacterium CG_4_10_14_0_8_um_filter_42_10]|uniref:Phosphoribosylaminoimidazole-succinocarboxamide synthase n=1 Tax=Candidatus Kerfeldbacteria bacterium CG_4_10_14_0_8_um_filter_42_10 TaxID=2014248 RepID=A0A2M7RIT3_9BACT|nr:MAG: phosphoribosylaminoimidazolesuccinocarboxamide synthase [Candidatus Kerfeldbacteria bacterium CG_4_10_14_0_8_um_filter_42_10]